MIPARYQRMQSEIVMKVSGSRKRCWTSFDAFLEPSRRMHEYLRSATDRIYGDSDYLTRPRSHQLNSAQSIRWRGNGIMKVFWELGEKTAELDRMYDASMWLLS